MMHLCQVSSKKSFYSFQNLINLTVSCSYYSTTFSRTNTVALVNTHLKTGAWSRRERTWYMEPRSAALAFIRKLKQNKAKKQKK